ATPYLAAGKPVLNAEYTQDGETTAKFCPADTAAGIIGALFDVDLDGSTYTPCAPLGQTTSGGIGGSSTGSGTSSGVGSTTTAGTNPANKKGTNKRHKKRGKHDKAANMKRAAGGALVALARVLGHVAQER
ncbi:MAG: hypothetical protein ACRDPA_05345, partial [Solirubrobacteraceae bacterium]